MKALKKVIFVLVLSLFTVLFYGCVNNPGKTLDFSLSVSESIYVNQVEEIYIIESINNSRIEVSGCMSTDEEVVLYNRGNILGYGAGEASVIVDFTYDGKTYSKVYPITVLERKEIIKDLIISGNKGVFVGDKVTLTTNVESGVAWSSSDESVASVDANGVVTGKAVGKAVITATYEKFKDVFEIHVFGVGDTTTVEGGEYYYNEVLRYNELLFGIKQTTHIGYTKTTTEGIDVDGIGDYSEIIDTSKYYAQQVNVLEVPSTSEISVVVWANTNNNSWKLNSVRSLIQDYEAQHPGYKVIAAINGDFFDINGNKNFPYSPSGANVAHGEYYKSSSGLALGFKNDGSDYPLVVGVPTSAGYLVLNVYDEAGNEVGEYKIESVNTEPASGQSSVYFGTYNEGHDYVGVSFDTTLDSYVIENAERTLPHSTSDFYGKGAISSLNKKMTLEKGQFAIVTDNEELKSALKLGITLRVQYEYVGDFGGVDSVIGYGEDVLINKEVASNVADSGNLKTRAPRTSIGITEDGTLVMCVVDGRQAKKNYFGVDGKELASIMKAYGCVSAYNLDGGGSSTMVIRTENGLEVLNSPSDGNERSDSNCVLIVAKDPGYKVEMSDVTINSATLNVSVEDDNYKNYPMYVKFEGNMYEVVDGKVKVDGLVSNTTYGYSVYYKNSKGELEATFTQGSFTTLKTGFEFIGIIVSYNATQYIFTAYYNDPENASKINNAKINIGDISTFLYNGNVKVKKDKFENGIFDGTIGIEFEYEDNGEVKTYKNDNVNYFMMP